MMVTVKAGGFALKVEPARHFVLWFLMDVEETQAGYQTGPGCVLSMPTDPDGPEITEEEAISAACKIGFTGENVRGIMFMSVP